MILRRVASYAVGLSLLFAVIGRFDQGMGAVQCGCAAECWVQRPITSAYHNDPLGPNTVELLLQALGFCYAVGYIANAAARGIEVTRMEYDVEGDVDVRTFLGLAGPRAGFTAYPGHRPGGESERIRPAAARAVHLRSGHLPSTGQPAT